MSPDSSEEETSRAIGIAIHVETVIRDALILEEVNIRDKETE